MSFERRLFRALDAAAAQLSGESRKGCPELFGETPAIQGKELSMDPSSAKRAILFSGLEIWETFEYAVRSELPLEREIAAFAVLAVRQGPLKAMDRSRPETRAVLAAAYKVRREIHRLLGLLRFAPDKDGILAAYCEPDHDILELLAPAFLRRFGPEPFRIVDLRRGFALASRNSRIDREPIREGSGDGDRHEDGGTPKDAPRELWRIYYRAAENSARSNPALRRQFMPKRYWKHLTELGDEP